MQVDIIPSGAVSLEMMHDLGELHQSLQAEGLDARAARASLPGVKDGALTVAIELAGLAVSSVSLLLSVLTYFSSKKPAYTVSVEAGGRALTVSQLDKAGAKAVLDELKKLEPPQTLRVRVSER